MLKDNSQNDHIAESSSRTNVAALTLPKSTSESSQSNLQSINQPTSNLQDLIKFLSANYGQTPPEIGTPEYMKLVEILQQNSVQQLNGRNNQDKIIGKIVDISKKDEKKPTAARVSAEKLWEGSLQLSSSVTLSAVASFKSGEKLVGNSWPESIEVKGKVRLEAFEKYVQDLPRSRNRGLMVISISWNEGSSNIGLAGMKEVTKGYKKSCRVGFAQLLSGIDLYICPRSDTIITILAKYGFFKGMAVIDDKPDSMIGCVVWRKNRPVNATSDPKSSPDSPPGFSTKLVAEKKPSPEKLAPISSQRDEPLTLPLTTASVEVDHIGGNSSSSSVEPCNLVRKRDLEDDDLPEFDFGKSTLVSQPISGAHRLTQPLKNTVDCDMEQSTKKVKLFDDDDMPELCPPKLHNQLPPQTTTSNFQTLPPPPPPRLSLPPPPVAQPPRADNRSTFSYQHFRPAISSLPPTFDGPPPLPPSPQQRPPPPPQQRPPPPPQQPPPPPRQPPPRPQQLRPPPPRPPRLPPQQPPRPPPQQPPQQPLPFNSSGGFNSNQVLWHRPPATFNVNLPFLPSNGRRL